MKKKATYRIRNRSEYNASLKKLGSLKILTDHSTLSRRRSTIDDHFAGQGLVSVIGRTTIVAGAWSQRPVFRFKKILGDRLQALQIYNQFKGLMLKSAILNRMRHLGIPSNVSIAG